MRVRLVGWCGLVLCLVASSLLVSAPAGAVAGYGDVAEDRYYTEPVQWSVDNDITDISGNCFGPDTPVSRGETAVYFWNMEGQPPAVAHSFSDIGVQAQNDAVSWMAAAGITTGTSPTTFSPDETLTRADLVTFLYRYQGGPDVTVDPLTPTCDASAFIAIAAGGLHSCGVRTDNIIACWGDNYWGQTYAPAGTFQHVSAGASHSCAIGTDNTITCWGNNHRGQSDAPAGEFSTVSASYEHSCGLRTDNTITCWGWNSYGQTNAPAGTFQNITTGTSHSCAIRTDNTITCWGWNSYGQTNAPAGTFQDVTTGAFHSCAIRTDNTITCWGWNFHGQTESPTRNRGPGDDDLVPSI